jgi:CDP-glucose 4,6-dehydratase
MGDGRSTLEGLVAMEWKGKRVFLTGHTGFKGSWLSLWLHKRGALVRGYALDPAASPNHFEVAHVGETLESCIGDLRDQARLQKEMQSFKPEIVIHMAAQSLVRPSYDQPLETYAINVMGTANLLEAVRTTLGVRSVIVVTTDKCYENHEWVWPYRENDRLGGYDPYSSSKAAAELVTASYRNSFFHPSRYADHGVAVATVRAGNVIGGGDWAVDRLIPDIIRAFHAGVSIRLRNPHAIRPWQHVLEPLRGYLMLAEALYDHGPEFGGAWNFGPRDLDALPVSKIAEQMARVWSADGRHAARWELDDAPTVHEAGLLRLDWSKAARELGWCPVFSIEEALKFTVSWYAAWSDKQAMRESTEQQIEAYERLTL